MITIQIQLPDDINKKIRVFQAKHNISNKNDAIIEMLKNLEVTYP